MVTFERVEEALGQAPVQPAEAHGVLAGMLCAAGMVEVEAWWAAIGEAESPAEVPEVLRELHAKTLASLTDISGSFELMLPADEMPLEARVQALLDWCQGFLYGYGLAGGRDLARLPADAAEVLRDVHQLAQAQFVLGEDVEEDEQAYCELVEYLRIGVLLVHELLHPKAEPDVKQPRAAWPGLASPTLH